MARVGWLGLAVLMGCTEQDLALQEVVGSDRPLDEVRERTEFVRLGQGRLTQFGPPIAEEPAGYAPQGAVAVTAVGERLQVVHEGPDAKLLIWVDREDLGRWAIDKTHGGARPGRAVGETGVWLDGGIDVEVVDQNGDFVAVDVSTDDLKVTAWFPSFDIGPYWIESEPTPQPRWQDADGFLRASAEILDAPDGDLLATLSDWGDAPAEPGEGVAYLGAVVLDQVAGYSLIETSQDGVRVVGWVLDADVAERIEGGRGGCGCGGSFGSLGGWGVFPALELPAQTPLFDAPEGTWVGETTTARGWAIVEEDAEGWTGISVPTPWGHATAYVW